MKAAPKIGSKDVVFNKPKTFVTRALHLFKGELAHGLAEQLLLCGSASSENDAATRIQQIEVRMNRRKTCAGPKQPRYSRTRHMATVTTEISRMRMKADVIPISLNHFFIHLS